MRTRELRGAEKRKLCTLGPLYSPLALLVHHTVYVFTLIMSGHNPLIDVVRELYHFLKKKQKIN